MAGLAFLRDNVTWVIGGIGGIGVLVMLCILWKNLKFLIYAAIVGGAGIGAYGIYKAGYNARVIEDVATQTKTLTDRLASMEAIKQADDERAERDAQLLAEMEKRANETPANPTVCLDRAARDRVQHVTGDPRSGSGAAAGAGAKPSKRPLRSKTMLRWRRGAPGG